MIEERKRQICNELIRIADQLINSIHSGKGDTIFWKTVSPQNDQHTEWVISDELYAGNAGILLFFIELYRYTRKEEYLSIIRRSSSFLISYGEERPTSKFSFYTGQTGIIYTLIKANEIDPYLNILPHIEKLTNNMLEEIQSVSASCDMIYGHSGIILGLLQIHALTNNEKLLPIINAEVKHLISGLNCTSSGIFIDRSHNQVSGLCGFSHGASGAGAIFLELGYYFSNPAFYRLAFDAFEYEDKYFDLAKNNWPDLRIGFYSEEDTIKAQEALYSDDTYFQARNFMHAWCHGAGGISLARLRAHQLLGDYKFYNQAMVGIENISGLDLATSEGSQSYTLCHGIGGNSDICLEMYLWDGQQKWLDMAFRAAENAIKTRNDSGRYKGGLYWVKEEDPSLFMGIAGIGHFLLRCLDPKMIKSILYTKIDKNFENQSGLASFQFININLADIQKYYLLRIYPVTARLVWKLYQKQIEEFIVTGQKTYQLKLSFISLVRQLAAEHAATHLLDAIKYDICVDALNYKYSNAMLFAQKTLIEKKNQQISELSDHQLIESTIEFIKENKLKVYQYNWLLYKRNLTQPANQDGKYYFIFIPGSWGVLEYQIGWLTFRILTLVKKEKNIPEIIKDIVENTDIAEQSKSILQKQILEQIRDLAKREMVLLKS